MKGYKPVNNRSLSDINRSNHVRHVANFQKTRDAWFLVYFTGGNSAAGQSPMKISASSPQDAEELAKKYYGVTSVSKVESTGGYKDAMSPEAQASLKEVDDLEKELKRVGPSSARGKEIIAKLDKLVGYDSKDADKAVRTKTAAGKSSILSKLESSGATNVKINKIPAGGFEIQWDGGPSESEIESLSYDSKDDSLSSAKAQIERWFKAGGNMADDVVEWAPSDFVSRFGVTDAEANQLYEFVKNHP